MSQLAPRSPDAVVADAIIEDVSRMMRCANVHEAAVRHVAEVLDEASAQ